MGGRPDWVSVVGYLPFSWAAVHALEQLCSHPIVPVPSKLRCSHAGTRSALQPSGFHRGLWEGWGKSALQITGAVTRVFPPIPGCAMSGLIADAKTLIDKARVETQVGLDVSLP